MSRLRSLRLVAEFDFFESIRSRKAIGLLVLYLAGASVGALLFVRVLSALEGSLAEGMGVAATERPGAMTDALLRSDRFERLLERMVGDPELAAGLTGMPVLALFFGWMSLTCVPLLAVLFSSDAISSELATGSARFALLRVDRLSWATGKLLAQALLMGVGILASAAATYLVGLSYLNSFAPGDTALWLLWMSGRAWLYGWPFLGLALAASQVTRSVNGSRALGLFVLAAAGLAGLLLGSELARELAPGLAPGVQLLVPGAHKLELWRADWFDRLPGTVMLLALGLAYFGLGHLRFAARDA
jgi:ABC-type transport system involved in multi-copper enzyme maturation permease subunit